MQLGTGYTFGASSKGQTLGVQKPWPDVFEDTGKRLVLELYKLHPFRITKITEEIVLLAGLAYNPYPQTGTLYTVVPGTVNATPVVFPGISTCDASLTYVYVQTYPDASIGFVTSSSPLANTNSVAYLLIGTLDINGVNQYVQSNILRERYKLGPQDADYHHSYTDLV
jgi:hypothetical protein